MIGATVAGLAGVLAFHSGSDGHTLLPAASATKSKGATVAGPPTTSPSAPSHQGSPTTAPPTTAPPTQPQSATGALVQYGYGQLSVKVTISGGKITAVSVATLQTAESYSQQIAQQAIPMLRREVLATQAAPIHGISGATYTSQAYADSAQSALDKLHFA